MEDDTVPEALLGAFSHEGGGVYRVRHAFGRDAVAVLIALAVAVGYAAVTAAVIFIIVALWGDDPQGALALTEQVVHR